MARLAPRTQRITQILATLGTLLFCARTNAQTKPLVLELSKPEAVSATQFGLVLSVVPLANGRLLVNDGARRRLVVLDANLSNASVLIDSVAVGGQAYGPVASPLIPYVGDSTLFVDGVARALLLIGPQGTVARTMAPPKPSDLSYLTFGASGTDTNGSLVYLSRFPLVPSYSAESVMSIVPSDSSPLVRANFDSRTTDTLTRLRQLNGMPATIASAGGVTTTRITINPLIAIDEWSVMSDGTVAVVRGHDYHVDLFRADGSKLSGPKLPFTFKRLTDADKQGLIDSSRKAMEQHDAETAAARANSGAKDGRSQPAASSPPQGFVAFTVKGSDQAAPSGPPKNIYDFASLDELRTIGRPFVAAQ